MLLKVLIGSLLFATAVMVAHSLAASGAGPRVPQGGGASDSCAVLYPKGWMAVKGMDEAQPAKQPRPPRGKPFADANYKTCVVRLTDHAADGLKGFARADYSRRQAFNADNTRVIVGALDGSWHLYDALAYEHVEQLPGLGADAEPQWHPTDSNLLLYFPPFGIGMELKELNVKTGRSRTIASLADRLKAIWPTAHAAWTKAEGSPSADGRYWALQVDDADWNGLGIVCYDRVDDHIIASYDLKSHGKERPDHVSMSPSGNYIVASFDNGPRSYRRDFTGDRQIAAKGEHSDMALDENGDDIYVSIDYQSQGGQMYMYNLRTAVRTDLFPTYLNHTATAMHFSGRAFQKPGWVLISTYRHSGSPQWLSQKVFAVQLRANPVIYNLAHHHEVFTQDPVYGGYFTEPHASVNRDFTRVVFNSNWDVSSAVDIDTYLIELPRDVIR